MNIIDIQDQLKNFSEQQLISEMQMPTGSAPQFLVLSEIKRRKRVRDDFTKREAANQPTVAQEAVAAAGMPQSGIMGMSEAMAPQAAVADGGIGSIMPQSMRPQTMPAPTDDAIPMAEGGVIRANIGAFFNPDGTPTEAGIRALIAQESGGDPKARGSLDELGIAQIRPSTALMPGYGVQSMFPEIAANIGEGKEYATAGDAYLANKDLIDAGLEDVDMSTRFTKDYLTAMSKRFPDDPNRALAAYNVGPGTAADLENPAEFDYVTSVLGRMGDGSDEPGIISKIASAINPISTAQAQGAGSPLVSPTMIFDDAAASPNILPSMPSEDGSDMGAIVQDGAIVMPPSEVFTDPSYFGDLATPRDDRSAQMPTFSGPTVDESGGTQTVVEDGAIVMKPGPVEPDMVVDPNVLSPVMPDFAMSAVASSDDEDTVEDPDAPPTTTEPEVTPSPEPERKGTDDVSTPQTGLAKEIADLQAKLEKDRETDKYLALAQAGLALMSSKEPTLLGAVGEAGISGLTAFREAQDRYQEGVVDLINAKAKMQGKTGSAFTSNQMIQRAKDLQDMATTANENGNLQRARELTMAANSLLAQAGLIETGGINEAFADQ